MTVGSRVLGGRYRLGSVLGQGGMAVVYRAEDLTLGRTVAVKVLREQLGAEPEFLERFRREARAAARLNHPNIIGVYDVGQEGLTNYIVMEYVEGEDLRERIRASGALAPEQVIDIGCQIAAALEFAHRSGLVHRDIKSQNVLVSPEGKIKVADFGIAIALGERSITEAGMVIGSVHYMAPEQADGRPTTAASDVYSLGIVMYEMATGQLPFTAESPVAIARLQLEAAPTPPQVINPRVPPAIADVILRCLEKEPEHRPASAARVAAALRGQRAAASHQTAHFPSIDGAHRPGQPGAAGQSTSQRPPARQPIPPPRLNGPLPPPVHETDVLMMDSRHPVVAPRRRTPVATGSGSRFWPLILMALLLAILGAAAGWILAAPPDNPSRPSPTAAPVVIATPSVAPTRPPAATAQAIAPTAAPAATATPRAPSPTPQPQPSATAVPPTPVPPTPVPTKPPLTPTVPAGLVQVPDVSGKSESDATKMLRDRNLTAKIEERRGPGVRDGMVMAQNPPSGAQVLNGSMVTVVVGRSGGSGPGPKPAPKAGFVLVPNVEGMDEKEARQVLEGENFKVEVRQDSSGDRKGQVIDQNPAAGDTVRPGASVRITIGT